jgi:hypothetical protein
LLLLAACGPTTPPSVAIDSPAQDATVPLGTDPNQSVPLAFSVAHFTLKAPGGCGGSADCGHVHVLVDGYGCLTPGSTYDNTAVSSPAEAFFAPCPSPTGQHTIWLELHHDDHSPVKDVDGQTISAGVSLTTQ